MNNELQIFEQSLGLDIPLKVGIQGSSATGVSSKTGEFVEKPRDFDIVIFNNELFDLVMDRAESLAQKRELSRGVSVKNQLGYVQNFKERGVALLSDSRLLPELTKKDFAGMQMESGIKLNLMLAREGSEAAQKHTIWIKS